MSGSDAEVVIVGGGPAGSSLAIQLARAGRDVLIVERSRFPRDKPCGDCVSPGAVAELGRLGVSERLRAELTPRPLMGWQIEAPDGRVLRAGFGFGNGAGPTGWAVRRRDLDAALLAEAQRGGARVKFGVRAFDLERRGARVCGLRAREGSRVRVIRGGVVVGADGLRSVVRGRLGLGARAPRLRKIALVCHLGGGMAVAPGRGVADRIAVAVDGTAEPGKGDAGAAAYEDGFGELRVRGGRCCGYAPLPGGANVTLVIAQREAAAIAGDPRAFFIDALSSFPEVLERIRCSGFEQALMVTGPFDYAVRRAWAPGALLVGDAAGYYDPFTGQGIYQALFTARLATEAILGVLARGEREQDAFARYGRRVKRALLPTRAVQCLVESVTARPRLMSKFIAALGEPEPGPAVRLLRVTGDLAHPLTLGDPFLWARTLYRIRCFRG